MTSRSEEENMAKKSQFYVEAITAKKAVIGYGVYDCVGGMVSRHAEFMVEPDDADEGNARVRANKTCANMNAIAEVRGILK
jgi:hypothetical protein